MLLSHKCTHTKSLKSSWIPFNFRATKTKHSIYYTKQDILPHATTTHLSTTQALQATKYKKIGFQPLSSPPIPSPPLVFNRRFKISELKSVFHLSPYRKRSLTATLKLYLVNLYTTIVHSPWCNLKD